MSNPDSALEKQLKQLPFDEAKTNHLLPSYIFIEIEGDECVDVSLQKPKVIVPIEKPKIIEPVVEEEIVTEKVAD